MVTATSIGKLKIQDRGDPDWDTGTEANLNRLEEMIASEVNVTSTGGAVSLTNTDYIANEARRAIIRCSGTLTSNLQITAPAPGSAKLYLVINATSGSYTTEIRFGSGAYLAIVQGTTALVMGLADGSSFVVSPPVGNGTGGAAYVAASSEIYWWAAVNRRFVDKRVITLLDRALDTPAVGPSTGDTYHLGASPTGDWSGHAGEIARWDGSSWIFMALPTEGLLAWVVDEGKLYVSDGGTLTDLVGAGGIADGAVTAAKLASDAVETAKILDANVTEAKLASNSVALAKLKSDVYASATEAKTQTDATKIVTSDNIKHAAFPAGTVMIFRQTSAPTGWTKITTSINNSALRITTGTPADGGSLDFSTAFGSARALSGTVGNTTLTESQIPAHRHYTFKIGSSLGTPLDASDPVSSTGNFGSNFSYTMGRQSGDADAAPSGPTGGGASHTHSLTMNTLAVDVKFVDVILATKDSP